jgi:nicotinate-nucleotide adenylyltransferase
MKIGLFFGSFNPIHVGHLILANYMAQNTDLEQIWFVVSPQNPFKKSLSLLHEFERFKMVELATADNHKLKVSDIEFGLSKPSYTIDTLSVLSEKFPEHTFTIILGEDNLVNFENWKNYEKILEYYDIVVYPRPKTPKHNFKDHPKVRIVDAPIFEISSTFIRKLIKENKDYSYLVTEPVKAHIALKKYYL